LEKCWDLILKYSKICFGVISVLGLLFLILCISSTYLKAIDSINVLASLSDPLLTILLFGGIGLITVGIIGFGRLHLKNHKNLFTALAAVAIPSLTFGLIFLVIITCIPLFPFPMRSEITNISVISNSPLTLSVDAKALTRRNSTIQQAIIRNVNDDKIVTDCYLNKPFFELPAYSTQTFIFQFNTTIPSGNYILQLACWHDHHGRLQFTIP
jgi:hypothetical protein